jgi:hypothetical protein
VSGAVSTTRFGIRRTVITPHNVRCKARGLGRLALEFRPPRCTVDTSFSPCPFVGRHRATVVPRGGAGKKIFVSVGRQSTYNTWIRLDVLWHVVCSPSLIRRGKHPFLPQVQADAGVMASDKKLQSATICRLQTPCQTVLGSC